MMIKNDITLNVHDTDYKLKAPVSSTIEELITVLRNNKDIDLIAPYQITANFRGRTISVSPDMELATIWEGNKTIEIQISHPLDNIEFIDGPSET